MLVAGPLRGVEEGTWAEGQWGRALWSTGKDLGLGNPWRELGSAWQSKTLAGGRGLELVLEERVIFQVEKTAWAKAKSGKDPVCFGK